MRISKSSSGASPLHGRVLITGGTSGIGLAFAKALAARGCSLVLVARSGDRLDSTKHDLEAQFGVECEILRADLSTEAGIADVSKRLSNVESPIEVFVNNAGQGLYHQLATTDTQPLVDGIALMATTPVRLGAVAGAAMKERGHGVIINTASVSGLVSMGLYSAIKSLVRVWSTSYAIELAPAGVQVVTFMPGWVRTEFHERAGKKTSSLPGFLWLTADRVVRECLNDVDRNKTYSLPSKRYKFIAALIKFAPRKGVDAVTTRINKSRD